jgi:hypothetical protein
LVTFSHHLLPKIPEKVIPIVAAAISVTGLMRGLREAWLCWSIEEFQGSPANSTRDRGGVGDGEAAVVTRD